MTEQFKKYIYDLLMEIRGGNQEIKESDSLKDDVGVDSLTMVSLIISIENHFGVEFEDSDLSFENLETVGSLLAMLEKYL